MPKPNLNLNTLSDFRFFGICLTSLLLTYILTSVVSLPLFRNTVGVTENHCGVGGSGGGNLNVPVLTAYTYTHESYFGMRCTAQFALSY